MRHLTLLKIIVICIALTQAIHLDASQFAHPHHANYVLQNWGLNNERAPSHINAERAWNEVTSNRKINVAVIDTGIDAMHPDLKKDVAKGGWNFITDTSNTSDDYGHGTHVSGIIEAVSNDKALIIPVKFYSENNSGLVNLRNTIKALNFAIDHGAKIINYSAGGPEFSEDEYLALKRAELMGILVIAAAGNDRRNTDLTQNRYYPAGYHLTNIISVAATDILNNMLASSNWGLKTVDVAAPGENIYSTLPGGRYGYMSGTSQATAFVTGIATLLLSENPNLKPQDIRNIILKSVDKLDQLKKKVFSGGRVNAYSALINAKQYTSPVN